MNSKDEDSSFENSENSYETRKMIRFKSQKFSNEEILSMSFRKKKRKVKNTVENDTRKINNLINIRSSKSVVFNFGSTGSNKNINKYNEEFLPEIIDPSYNFTLNYQLKETAINVFKSGIEKDKTKIKFFSNYLYQLSPFNKIFLKIKQSNNNLDMYNLERVLYSLSTDLNYEYFESNKIIFKHGDIPDKYFILLKGEVNIIVPNEIEVMMNEYEYFFYILRLYKFQEHSLLKKVLNKNYNIYPLNKKLLEDWIYTGYNTLRYLKKESELNKSPRKPKKIRYNPSYNAEELFNRLEKQKKLNLLMMNKNVIILLEKIRMRNERAREAAKNKGLSATIIENKNKNNDNDNDNNSQPIKSTPTVGYTKLDGQLKKIFMNDEQIEVIEKCSNEITQLIEILSKDFNMRKFLNELNRCNSQNYLTRIEPIFFDEDTNEKLDSKLFIISRNQENIELENIQKKRKAIYKDDIRYKLKNLFNETNKMNKKKKKNELFNNRKKTIVYHYVLVNTLYSGESFGEISNEAIKKNDSNQRISTIITRENSHLASLKRSLYNKILKQINENNLHQQLTFLFSLEIFKNCNKNNFMKNYINFFIKKTFRSNEIVFNQDDDLGEDRSIYFIEEGTFSSYCKMSLNDIEILFKNLHYDGLIPEDYAHEDNLFNKENHYFNIFKTKKIFFNLLYFSTNDIIGFNDALYNGKYIYTVKCQTSTATVYEIKLKFFNLIINSEEKVFKNLVKYEMIKRNLMIKFFLNSFNNKNNFYKLISFTNDENDKKNKTIVHKNYFGKNPFRDPDDINKSNNYNKKNKNDFKANNIIHNSIDNKNLILIARNKRVNSPEIKKYENCRDNLSLNNKSVNNKSLISFESKNKLIFRNKSKINMKNSTLITTRTNNFHNAREHIENKDFYSNKKSNSNNKINTISNKDQIFMISNVLKKNIEKTNNDDNDNNNDNDIDSYELKIEEYQSKSKNKIVIPPIITNQINKEIHLNNKSNNLYSSLFDEKQDNKTNNNINLKLFINNQKSFNSNDCIKNTPKTTSRKRERKIKKKFIKYLDRVEDNINLKNNDISKNEQLKCYLKEIPDFFNNVNCTKNIYFGMNKKSLFKNNGLFTQFK